MRVGSLFSGDSRLPLIFVQVFPSHCNSFSMYHFIFLPVALPCSEAGRFPAVFPRWRLALLHARRLCYHTILIYSLFSS